MAVHRIAGRPHPALGRARGRRDTVFPEHGSRALHARHRRNRGDGLQSILEALGPRVRGTGVFRESMARMGDQFGHACVLPVRRLADNDRDRQSARDWLFTDVRTGHLRGARAPDFRQSRGGADAGDPGDDLRDRARVVARVAGRHAELRQDSRGAEHRVDLRRDRLRRIWRRTEPVPEQLDSRQRVRHGAVRTEAGQPGHRDCDGGPDRAELHLRADAREHGPVAKLVAVRERRAGIQLRAR